MDVDKVNLWGIAFDDGSLDVDYDWNDLNAGDHGLTVRLHSGILRKGSGTLVASAAIDPGAKLRADVVASAIPLDEISAFREAFDVEADSDSALQNVRPEANVSFVATLGGTLSRLQGRADVDISPMRIGPDVLPSSRVRLEFVPEDTPERFVGTSKCGNGITPPFDALAWTQDAPSGFIKAEGQLFGGQVDLTDIQVTQQRSQMVSGELQLVNVDLGAFANLIPGIAFSESPPHGRMSARVVVDELPVKDPGLAEVRVFLHELKGQRAGDEIQIGAVAEPLVLSGDALRIPSMKVDARLKSGLKGTFAANGTVANLSKPDPRLSLALTLDPVDLSKLGVELPQIERAEGTVRLSMAVNGSLDSPRLSGRLDLRNGMLRIKGIPLPLDDIDIDIRVDETEARIHRATARSGNTGQIAVSGRIPLRNLSIAGARRHAHRHRREDPHRGRGQAHRRRAAPRHLRAHQEGLEGASHITGRITLEQLQYTRPMNFQPPWVRRWSIRSPAGASEWRPTTPTTTS